MDAEITIRPMARGDFEGLNALLNGASPRAAPKPASLPPALRQRIEDDGENSFRLVALCGSAIIAQASLLFGDAARLTILVHADHRGAGLGKALLRQLLCEAEARFGLAHLEAHVFHDNAPAIALYRRLGFSEDRRASEVLIMVKTFPCAAASLKKAAHDLA